MTKKHILSARNAERKTVSIDEVPNGKNCGCICAECGEKLIAKNNGTVKIHHFAHESGNNSIKCAETALHLLGKKIIIQDKMIPVLTNGTILFDKVDFVEQEKDLGDIKPDLYAMYKGEPVAVEICVSHAVDEVKVFKIQKHKLTTFEIDLSNIVYETEEDVRKAIYDLKNIKLIYDFEMIHFFQSFLDKKKEILLNKGIFKPIKNGIVQQCHMCGTIINGRYTKWHNVSANFCYNCFFSYSEENMKGIYCLGHLTGQVPLWFLQSNLNENRFMPVKELQEKLISFKREIQKFIV